MTDQKQTDDDLKLRNMVFSAQTETTIDAILIVDDTDTIIFQNKYFIELWGIPEEIREIKDKSIIEDYVVSLLADPERSRRMIDDIYKDRQRTIHGEIILRDGRCFDRYSVPMISPDNKYFGRIWYFRDKTGQKHYEEQLRRSEEKLASIINFLPDATFVINTEGIVIAWNRAMEELTGVPSGDILGLGDFEYSQAIHGSRNPILIDFALKPDHDIPSKYTYCRRDGNRFVAETYSTYLRQEGIYLWGMASPLYDAEGTVVGAIESIRDVTTIKRTEQILKQREELYSAIVEDQTELICRVGPDNTLNYANEAYLKFFNIPRDQITVTSCCPHIFREDKPLFHQYLSGISRSNPVITLEIRVISGEGDVRWIRWNIRGFFSESGKIIQYQAVGRDITDFVWAKESTDLNALLLNQVNDAIIATGLDLRITCWNRAAEELFGWKARDVLGQDIHSLIRFDLKKYGITNLADHLRTHGSWSGSLVQITKTKKRVLVEWRISIFKDHAGNVAGTIGVCRQVPDNKPDKKA